MEGETYERVEPTTDAEKPAFLRVEFDGEHKIFVKECSACGSTFSTSVPKKFFWNPDDDSTELRVNGGGIIDGSGSISAEAVEAHILNQMCADTTRHSSEENAP